MERERVGFNRPFFVLIFLQPMRKLTLIILIAALSACQNKEPNADNKDTSIKLLQNGEWRFSLKIENEELPFNVELSNVASKDPKAVILNGDERIESSQVTIKADSIWIRLPVFDTELRGKIESQNLITGFWINKTRQNYSIPFVAEYNKNFRFTPAKTSTVIKDRYHVIFGPNSEDQWDAILLLNQNPNKITGTFITETGDYRYLEGNIMNDKLYLSTFDGSHAFLFHADIDGDSLINGSFVSGIHYQADWLGNADTTFTLRKPQDLTYLKEGYEYLDFKLPNENGDTVTWDDMNLANKVVIVDIMGSWCPNCMDASASLKELTASYNSDEIEILPIAFELTSDLDAARKRIFKMQSDLGMKKKFLFGGYVSKEKAADTFPMLNKIMSYPTLIFIGKDREIKQIYTGFYGPGTGTYYTEFMSNTKKLLDRLVAEEG
ncbi:TlpA family protein disulfide reductase [Cryomorpha ignava]|uniref:TlpA family protein disulfide reductase n=2 Tax=Cryomorpha ignava TaxID=101383 RepID=A0A7K3WKF2_9FLAO|nr:TlpA family protein disulfide reductase [Cryomorpha ignava]